MRNSVFSISQKTTPGNQAASQPLGIAPKLHRITHFLISIRRQFQLTDAVSAVQTRKSPPSQQQRAKTRLATAQE